MRYLEFFAAGVSMTQGIAAVITMAYGGHLNAADPVVLMLCVTHGVLTSCCRTWRNFVWMWMFVIAFTAGAACFDLRIAAAGLFLAPAAGFTIAIVTQPKTEGQYGDTA